MGKVKREKSDGTKGKYELNAIYFREWINKVLLYSAGNYIQNPEISHSGKEYEKELICYTAELSHHCDPTIFQ